MAAEHSCAVQRGNLVVKASENSPSQANLPQPKILCVCFLLNAFAFLRLQLPADKMIIMLRFVVEHSGVCTCAAYPLRLKYCNHFWGEFFASCPSDG